MKKYRLLILCILCIGIFLGCQSETVFKFSKEEIQSLFVHTNNFKSGVTTTNWVYKKDDMKDFLYYLKNLPGKKVNNLDTKKLTGLFYGVELNGEHSYHILFAGDYVITSAGEYYLTDGEKAEKMCQSIVGDTKVKEDVSYIVNHRYLSLAEGHWDTKYMTSSKWTGEQMKNVQLLGEKSSVDTDEKTLGLTILNNTGKTIEFGSRLTLETLINDAWYNINDMINENVNLAWTDILYMLGSGKSKEAKFHLSYYQPLPAGRYRLIKEVTTDVTRGYAAYEFNVE
jgi:hypothetical protein